MKLQRLLRVAPLALLFASVASAQTTGNIIGVVTDAQSGKPIVGALVIATSPSSQGEQTAVTDKSGGFRFQSLSPGEYKLASSFDGFKPAERADLTVRIDKTIRANLSMVPDAVQMEEQVVKTGVAPVINVGSAESGTVVSREFLSNVPGSRGFENVAVTAPTAQFDLYGISFAGASSPENGYLLDGMNVGDAGYGNLASNVLNSFVQEIDIKTGSFMPEYGFSTGGIVSVVTKSGSNEFHGSVFGNFTSGALTADAKSITSASSALARQRQKSGTYYTDFGFEVGGPIIKDRLWFYAGFAPVLTRTAYERYASWRVEDPANPGTALLNADGYAVRNRIAGSESKYTNEINTYQAVGKLTYLFNENNQLAVSLFYVPSSAKGISGSNGADTALSYDQQSDFTDVVARYSSKLLNKKLQFELTGGYHGQKQENRPVTTRGVDGGKAAQVVWSLTHSLSDFENIGADPNCAKDATTGFNPCAVLNYVSGGSGYIDSTDITRLAGKAAVSYFAEAAGNHQLKAGVDLQKTSYQHSKRYSGPNNATLPGGAVIYERSVAAGASGTNSGVNNAIVNPTGIWFQDYRRYGLVAPDRLSAVDAPNGELKVKSESNISAYYLQDSYSPSFLDGLTLNVGVRWETQDMSVPAQPGTGFSINNSVGPRIQAIYDWTKQGRSKVAASYGRFFASFPLDMSDRSFGGETQIRAYRPTCAAVTTALTGTNKDALAGAPESCPQAEGFYNSSTYGNYTYSPYSPGIVPVAPDIKSPFVDMFSGSVEYELFSDFSLGFEYQGRRQGPVIEDMSPDEFVHAAIANPGTGKPFDAGDGFIFDPKMATSTDAVTGRTFQVPFDKPKRDFDSFTVLAKKNFSNKWLAQVSYTYSSLRGNYTGYFKPETGQFDPGINSTYDLASLLSNANGPLPGDMPHSFKAYGSYAFDFGPSLQATAGAALRVTSGTPVNFLIAHVDYGAGEGYGLPRGSGGRTPTLTNLDLKGGVSYTISPPYKVQFTVDIFNILNNQEAVTVDENWTFDSTQPLVGAQCSSRNAASKSNPIQAALTDCPSLNYMKSTDGLPATINPNFAKATSIQAPLSVRLGLELSF
jgi:hypothetical protein